MSVQMKFGQPIGDPEADYCDFLVAFFEQAGDQIAKHQHGVGHWGVVCHGAADYLIAGKLVTIEAGERVWIPKNTDHQIIARVPGTRTMCIMPGGAL